MTLGSILQFFVSHILVWITNQSKQLFKLLIPKWLYALAGIELNGWVRFSLTPMTAFHQRTGFVPSARWSRIKLLQFIPHWCQPAAGAQDLLWGTYTVSKGMIMCFSNKCCLGKMRMKHFKNNEELPEYIQ